MKFGWDEGWTTSVTVLVWDRLPLVAVISGCEVPVGVFDAVLIASRARSIGAAGRSSVVPSLSFQLADAPLGSLVAFKATDP